MALADKNIVITPNISNTAEPKIVFSGANSSVTSQNITITSYPTSNGTLSFDGTSGQLFSISNDLSNTLFTVADISGIPSAEVYANGQVNLAKYGGNVAIGAASTTTTITGAVTFGNTSVNTTANSTNITLKGTLTANGGNGTAGQVLTSGAAGNVYWATAGGVTTFSGLSDTTTAALTVDEIYLQATTTLTVTASGTAAYLFDQYAGNNPTIYATSGTTIAFDLGTGALSSHPFLIRFSGANYDTGLTHVTSAGVVTTGSSAQGKTSGTLYWKIPSGISGTYGYLCSNHGTMIGVITINPETVTATSLGLGSVTNESKATMFTSPTFTGTATLQTVTEVLNTKTGATGVVAHDYGTGSTWYHSSIAASFTANITNVPTTDNRSIVINLILIQGATAYIPSALQVGGSALTIKWVNGVTPTGNPNKVDIATFTLIRTGAAWAQALGTYGSFG